MVPIDRLRELREEKGVSQRFVARELGFLPQTYSNYENGTRQPDQEALVKAATYFHVPTDFLLGRPPFDCWEDVRSHLSEFFSRAPCDAEFLDTIFGIKKAAPEKAKLADIIEFIKLSFRSMYRRADGEWFFEETNPQNQRAARDQEIKAALFGGDGDITDDMWDDVKRYAAFIKARKEEMSGKDGQS